ncbi:MAG: LacI family DNA-binding transcriptional regulator [Pseudomonadota bacterium]
MKALSKLRHAGLTLEDVARIADVSPATVSRCLNRPETVNVKKRERVLAAVERLGYVPHGAARALASRQSRMVGVVFPSIDNSLFGAALDAFQRTMADAGYTVIVASSAYDPELETQHIRRMLQSGIDALMLVGTERPDTTYRMIHARNIPYVTVWRTPGESSHPSIGFDNVQAAKHLSNYLIGLGHRRIAFFSGHLEHNDRARDRLEGVRQSHTQSGFTFDDSLILQRPFGVDGGRHMLRACTALPSPPTAIICGAEPFAYGAIFEAAALGIGVPAEISVAAFDDTWLAAQISPKLTTVRTPNLEIGEEAARYLIARLAGENAPPALPLDTELIIRESTAPPSQPR